MAINVAQDPPVARKAANDAFSNLKLPTNHDLVDGIADTAEVGSLPLYNLSVSDLANGQLGSASQTGWRYIRLQANGRIGDTIEVGLGDNPTLVSHAGGQTAERLSRAGTQALEDVTQHDLGAEFDARILRVPEIGIEAIWLVPRIGGIRPRFFGIPASQADKTNDVFLDFAVTRAQRYLMRLPRPRAGAQATQQPHPIRPKH